MKPISRDIICFCSTIVGVIAFIVIMVFPHRYKIDTYITCGSQIDVYYDNKTKHTIVNLSDVELGDGEVITRLGVDEPRVELRYDEYTNLMYPDNNQLYILNEEQFNWFLENAPDDIKRGIKRGEKNNE